MVPQTLSRIRTGIVALLCIQSCGEPVDCRYDNDCQCELSHPLVWRGRYDCLETTVMDATIVESPITENVGLSLRVWDGEFMIVSDDDGIHMLLRIPGIAYDIGAMKTDLLVVQDTEQEYLETNDATNIFICEGGEVHVSVSTHIDYYYNEMEFNKIVLYSDNSAVVEIMPENLNATCGECYGHFCE